MVPRKKWCRVDISGDKCYKQTEQNLEKEPAIEAQSKREKAHISGESRGTIGNVGLRRWVVRLCQAPLEGQDDTVSVDFHKAPECTQQAFNSCMKSSLPHFSNLERQATDVFIVCTHRSLWKPPA